MTNGHTHTHCDAHELNIDLNWTHSILITAISTPLPQYARVWITCRKLQNLTCDLLEISLSPFCINSSLWMWALLPAETSQHSKVLTNACVPLSPAPTGPQIQTLTHCESITRISSSSYHFLWHLDSRIQCPSLFSRCFCVVFHASNAKKDPDTLWTAKGVQRQPLTASLPSTGTKTLDARGQDCAQFSLSIAISRV